MDLWPDRLLFAPQGCHTARQVGRVSLAPINLGTPLVRPPIAAHAINSACRHAAGSLQSIAGARHELGRRGCAAKGRRGPGGALRGQPQCERAPGPLEAALRGH